MEEIDAGMEHTGDGATARRWHGGWHSCGDCLVGQEL